MTLKLQEVANFVMFFHVMQTMFILFMFVYDKNKDAPFSIGSIAWGFKLGVKKSVSVYLEALKMLVVESAITTLVPLPICKDFVQICSLMELTLSQ